MLADPILLKGLQLAEPHSIVVSAKTGDGLSELMAEIERLLPRPSIEVSVLLPYARGDLLARAHREGEIFSVEHTDAGTALTVRVQPALACELDRFVVTSGPA